MTWHSTSTISTIGAGIFAVTAVWITVGRFKKRKQLPFPPGPPRLPLIGNLLNNPIESSAPWQEYVDLSHKYGDVMYFNVVGQPIVVLSSIQSVADTFDKRSSVYASKITTTMVHDLMDMWWFLSVMPYGERWRRTRREFHLYFHPDVVNKYNDVLLKETRAFLRRVHATPDDFFSHIRLSFASTIMKIMYDIEIKDPNDPYIDMAGKGIHGLGIASQPGRFLADAFPIMQYIPSWFPGAYFRRLTEEYKGYFAEVRNAPFNHVKEQLRAGTAGPSITASMLERIAESPNVEEAEVSCRDAAGVAYFGGSDTTLSSIQAFFLAMVLYPEVQRKAQEELDKVVGLGRLPEFTDRTSLPYIEAMVTEILRWHVVFPIGIPHYTTEDDEYKGYYIPKGTVVIGNAWGILHDPDNYSDPEEFKPERFLDDFGKINPNALDPEVACFGYGRRICPGRYFAKNSLFIQVASILQVFSITPALDENGKPIDAKYKLKPGILSYPEPFKCSIRPRSAAAKALLTSTQV